MVVANQLIQVGQGIFRLRSTHQFQCLRRRAARNDGLHHYFGRNATVRGFGHGHQHVDALGRIRRAAHHMQALRDQRVLQLQHVGRQLGNARIGVARQRQVPQRRGRNQVEFGGQRLNDHSQVVATRCIGIASAPVVDAGFQINQAFVQTGLAYRRREVADQRGAGTAFGNRAFRRVVGRVQVNVGHVADEAVWPARARHARLLARHKFQRAVGAEVQHGVGFEVFAQVAVEGRERMRRSQALLKQQAHRVALVTEGRLHANQHVSELFAQHHDGLAIAELLARRWAPLSLDLRQPALAAHMVIGGYQGVHIAVGPVLRSVADQHAVAQRVHIGRHVHRVALGLHGGERVEH